MMSSSRFSANKPAPGQAGIARLCLPLLIGPARLSIAVVREYLFILALLTIPAGAAEPQYQDACPPAWLRDTQCFKEQTVYFKTASALLSTEAERRIAEVASYLKAHPRAGLTIEGHCDDRGSAEHNRQLGARRAQAIAKELVRLGVPADHLDTLSYGDDRPAETGHDAKARKKNRRAEFVLLWPPVPEDPAAHNQTLHSTPQ
jgi:outer membrane protein OmpA-like peptidoglycan-associated protein